MKGKNTYRWDGQVTVFALFVFMLVVSVLASQYRSALFYAVYGDAYQAASLSADAFLSTYQRALRDRYGILAVDAGYGQKTFAQDRIEKQLLQVFENNMQGSLIFSQVESMELAETPIYTWLIDGDWTFFVREITLNRQGTVVDQGFEWIKDRWLMQNHLAESDFANKKHLADEEQRAFDAAEEEEIPSETPEAPDPRDGLMDIWNQGVLRAACPSDYKISDKKVLVNDVSFPADGKSLGVPIDFHDEIKVFNLFEQMEDILNPKAFMGVVAEDMAVQSYIREYFRNAVNVSVETDEVDHVLDYETEYLISGQESDKENLKAVLWKLLALRLVFNLSYLMTSSEKSQQVFITASALSSAVFLPQLTEMTAFVLKIAWAFAESLADCRTLLSGGQIPILKDDASWYLTWNEMLSLNAEMLDGNPCMNGWDYETYLRALLMFSETDTTYRRMTHLMEKNIRMMSGYEGFQMKNCIYGIQIKYALDFKIFGNREVQTALTY